MKGKNNKESRERTMRGDKTKIGLFSIIKN
jgi:hypothetical protein